MLTTDQWDQLLPRMVDVLRAVPFGTPAREAVQIACDQTGIHVHYDQLASALSRRGHGPISSMLGSAGRTAPAPAGTAVHAADTDRVRAASAASPAGDGDARFADLVRIADRGRTFAQACDDLDVSPRRLRTMLDDAAARGYRIGIAGEVVARTPDEHTQRTADVGAAPVVGDRCMIAVISDTHFGSKYCLREPLREFIQHAYARGVRHVLHAGDVLDGCYDHGRWELSHHGVDDQIQDCLDTLPVLPGLAYHYISGNHDLTFTSSTGLDTGRLIEDRARTAGRTDLHYHGARGALLRLNRVKVALWHPRSGKSYALSYQLQNHIRDLPSATNRKPDLLFAGHWHTSVSLEQRAVHASAVPCWQGGGSAFGKSLGGAPSIGGLIVSWDATEGGTLRRVAVERTAYYEVETWRDVG